MFNIFLGHPVQYSYHHSTSWTTVDNSNVSLLSQNLNPVQHVVNCVGLYNCKSNAIYFFLLGDRLDRYMPDRDYGKSSDEKKIINTTFTTSVSQTYSSAYNSHSQHSGYVFYFFSPNQVDQGKLIQRRHTRLQRYNSATWVTINVRGTFMTALLANFELDQMCYWLNPKNSSSNKRQQKALIKTNWTSGPKVRRLYLFVQLDWIRRMN